MGPSRASSETVNRSGGGERDTLSPVSHLPKYRVPSTDGGDARGHAWKAHILNFLRSEIRVAAGTSVVPRLPLATSPDSGALLPTCRKPCEATGLGSHLLQEWVKGSEAF